MAHFAKAVAQRLKNKLADSDWTMYRLAEESGVSRQTIANILNGDTWCDLPTIYRLEVALQEPLWVNEDIPSIEHKPSTDDHPAGDADKASTEPADS